MSKPNSFFFNEQDKLWYEKPERHLTFGEFQNILSFIPKQNKERAKLFFEKYKDNLMSSENGRIIYFSQGSPVEGSALLDVFKWISLEDNERKTTSAPPDKIYIEKLFNLQQDEENSNISINLDIPLQWKHIFLKNK